MKKKVLVLATIILLSILLFIVIFLLLIGTRQQSYVELGKWNNNVFCNEWANVNIENPSNYKRASANEFLITVKSFEEMFGRDIADVLVNLENETIKTNKDIIYDLCTYKPGEMMTDAYILLKYEKAGITKNQYLNKIKIDLNKNKSELSSEYIIVETSSITIAGENYLEGTLIEEGNDRIKLTFYIRKKGDRMICFIAYYLSSEEDNIRKFIDEIYIY